MSKEILLKWMQEGNVSIPGFLLANYKEMGLNEQELVLLLQMMSLVENGNEFPTPVELSSRMTISADECSQLLRRLLQKRFIEINEHYSAEGIRHEKFDIIPLKEKMIDYFLQMSKKEETLKLQAEETDLYSCFEKEFGRPLSPFECESMALWMDDDGHEPIIIKAALREAVLSGKLNFRYIDRILFEWKRNGIKTIEQAKSYGKKFRQNQGAQRAKAENATAQQSPNHVPFYNWLEQ